VVGSHSDVDPDVRIYHNSDRPDLRMLPDLQSRVTDLKVIKY
jgi:hypothetical protein